MVGVWITSVHENNIRSRKKKCKRATFSIFSSCLSNCILSARNSYTHFTHIYMTTVNVNICLHHSYRVNTTKTIAFKYLCIVSYRTTYVWRCFCVEPFLVCSTIFYLNFNSVLSVTNIFIVLVLDRTKWKYCQRRRRMKKNNSFVCRSRFHWEIGFFYLRRHYLWL